MGNAIGGKRRRARVMTVDGTTYKYRPPAVAGAALRDHPGHHLLESEDVKRLGLRARPLDADAPLKPGKLYFLVELPRLQQAGRAPRRTWSGQLLRGAGSSAGERLESLMTHSRRSASDVASALMSPASSVEAAADGSVRLRIRLPKADVARLVEKSRDAADAAEKIMKLCVARDHRSAPATPLAPLPALASSAHKKKQQQHAAGKKEKRTRFEDVPDEIIWF